VRAVKIALEVRFGGFAVQGQFFQPKAQGVPVDEKDDPKREQWIRYGTCQQGRVI
jgi:hypothetical protein